MAEGRGLDEIEKYIQLTYCFILFIFIS